MIFYDSLVSSIFIAALILPPMSAISLLSNNLHCCVLVLETLCNSRQQPVVLLVRPGVVNWIHFSSDFRKQSLENRPALGTADPCCQHYSMGFVLVWCVDSNKE